MRLPNSNQPPKMFTNGSFSTHALFFALGLFVASGFLFYVRFFSHKSSPQSEVIRLDAVEQIKNVLKLGVIETQISQIYDVRRDNLKIQEVPVPWTGQKSIVAVKGSAQIGFNLEQAEIISDRTKKIMEVRLPDPAILSLDLDFHFLHEEDSFLRRLTPDDRNKILEEVKNNVRQDLLSPELKSRVEKRTNELAMDFTKIYGISIEIKKKLPPS